MEKKMRLQTKCVFVEKKINVTSTMLIKLIGEKDNIYLFHPCGKELVNQTKTPNFRRRFDKYLAMA